MNLRIGVINIMPKAEGYEKPLLETLGLTGFKVQPLWIRLSTHAYRSSDPLHLKRRYCVFSEALRRGPLHGLILSGAPVEKIPYEEVHYWPELSSILDLAGGEIPSVLGLCWGGLALAKRLGVEKEIYPRKLFGVFQTRNLDPRDPLMEGVGELFPCPQSRYAGFRQADVERAEREGTFKALAWSKETGTTLFRTPDFRFVGHIGHPEYPTERLALEYFRDKAKGLADVCGPVGYDPDHPLNTWGQAGVAFFRGWLRLLASLAEGSADEGERP